MKQAIHEIQLKNILTWKEKLFWFKLYFTHETSLIKSVKEECDAKVKAINQVSSWIVGTVFIILLLIAMGIFFAIVTNFSKVLIAILLLPVWIALIALLVFLSGFGLKTTRDLFIFFFCYKFERGYLERTLNRIDNKAVITVHVDNRTYQSEQYPRRFYELHDPKIVLATNKRFPEQQYLFNEEYETAQKYNETIVLKQVSQ